MKDVASSPALSPGGKKLVQARLPFKLVSPSSPAAPTTPPSSRKRKSSLSAESASKITKPCIENEVAESIVISEEETEKESPKNFHNPYVKMVDVAIKKKLRRKESSSKKTTPTNGTKSKKNSKKILEKENVTDNNDAVSEKVVIDAAEHSTVTAGHFDVDVEIHEGPSSDSKKNETVFEVKKNRDNGETPANENLTPKQLQRKLESEKKRAEKEKDRQERELKRQQEKEERERIKQEKEDQRKKEREDKEEQKKKEKEEKEEQKRKEKEEKEKQKELERKEREEKEEQRRKEKEEKEEQRRREKEARDEEKRRKQEAMEMEKQEQEAKKKKAAAAFVSFFFAKQKTEQAEVATTSQNSMLSTFALKNDMRLAPRVRRHIDETQKSYLDSTLKSQIKPSSDLYLQQLKDKGATPKTGQRTWPLDEMEDDCVIIDSEDELPPTLGGAGEVIMASTALREKLRPKLLSFHENRRPPYWGTWRKKSDHVRPRRPFVTDTKLLDYEVDSDCEWEDEADGESIAGSVAGSVEDPADDYEVDNGMFVPHGYLSDEEGTMDEEEPLALSPETQKERLKHLEEEFENEMKKPTEKLRPRVFGALWENTDGSKPANCLDAVWKYFGKMAMIMEDPTPLLQPAPQPEVAEKKAKRKREVTDSPKSAEKKKKVHKKEEGKRTGDKERPNLKNQPGINSFLSKVKN